MAESTHQPSGAEWPPAHGTIPGTVLGCFLITAITVLVALFAGNPDVDRLLRPLYFAVLFGFFRMIGRRQPDLRVLPFRLVETGFGVLTAGFVGAAVMRVGDPTLDAGVTELLVTTLERGAVFLLGMSLVTYGIVLWIPELLKSQRVLRDRYDRTRGKLQKSERSRARMEQRLVDAQRLHAIGELAAGIAHDLRNPLAIINATADSLRRSPRSPDEIEEHVQVISRNIDRAERTICGLLELGKPRVGSLAAVAVDAALAEIITLAAVEGRRRGIELRRSGQRDLHALADRKLLAEGLINLVLNALQASPDGSAVEITTRTISLGGEQLVAIAVEDRGSGIKATSRNRLFTPFFTTKPEGTGLGLLSTRRTLEEMGGRVGLFPRRSGGARAIVLLPTAPNPQPVEAPCPAHAS